MKTKLTEQEMLFLIDAINTELEIAKKALAKKDSTKELKIKIKALESAKKKIQAVSWFA